MTDKPYGSPPLLRPLRDGDIYFWSWKDAGERFMPYHCCACIAVVGGGVLRDTFWTATSDNRVITDDVAHLTHQGNVQDMPTIPAGAIDFSRPEEPRVGTECVSSCRSVWPPLP